MNAAKDGFLFLSWILTARNGINLGHCILILKNIFTAFLICMYALFIFALFAIKLK